MLAIDLHSEVQLTALVGVPYADQCQYQVNK